MNAYIKIYEAMAIKWNACQALMRLDKPIGTLLLLWPTLIGLWVASTGHPSPKLLLVFIAGVFITRSAGCVINDICDRNLDGKVERTQHRPLANQSLSLLEAYILLSILACAALGLALLLNPLTLKLAFVGAAFSVLYPLMKRIMPIPQLVLGMTFNWGIIMSFSAVLNHVPWFAWVLYCVALLWTVAYDTMYGMVDIKDDLKIGIHSSAIYFGRADRVVIAVLQGTSLLLLLILGWTLKLNAYYYCSLIAATGFMFYQHYLIRTREPRACFKAFLNNNWLTLVVFVGVFLTYLQ